MFVVDDDPSFLRTMARWLRAFGYAVESYSSAKDFLTRRQEGAGGCVVADLKMPDMDGMALQRALAESGNPLPIVFLTGHGDIPTSVRAIRDGAEDFLVKTVAKEELIAAIDRALAREACQREDRTRRQELEQRFKRLTPRENEVLAHVLRGRLNKQIAADLGIAERSVKRHRTSLMQKLDAKSIVELTQLAEKAKIRERSTVSGNALPRRPP